MVNFAVVGLGMGRNRAQMIKDTDGAELNCVVDLQADLAKKTAQELGTDWEANLDDVLGRGDIDCVMVMTPSGTHAEIGIRAAKAGKHVVTTKPMDVSTEACDRLIAACDEAGVKLAVDYQSRYVDSNYRVAEALSRGWLGRPILGEIRFKWFRSDEYFEHNGSWRGTWKMDGGGSLANQGAHLLDVISWFMGDFESVYGETAIMNHDIETEDIGLAIVRFKSGARGVIVGTTTFPTNAYFSAEVHGTDGGILIEDVLGGKMRVFGEGLEERLLQIDNPIQSIVEDVVRAVEEGENVRVDGREGRRTVALLEKIYESARTGKSIGP
ncbi:MAG: Gfo/Idh/MocA family oxidoreductase [Candidatus Poribacteria bacterium]|nr:Gfo/Idh/MocA family oxidoreductase [Candidatus Poribacteria bacterium]MDE0506189.1 Gfo/Idh/MocA family oxidoreductase [Candidatus Poribacteria bacterium]